MHFATVFVVATAISIASKCHGTSNSVPSTEIVPRNDISLSTVPKFSEPSLLVNRGSTNPKRPKYTKRPRPHPHRPRYHPKGCTNTELIKNGDFNKNVRGWELIRSNSIQFFWIKDSKKRPSHSGAGQGYLFLPRGYSSTFLTTTIPAVEYGNSVTVSAWLRFEQPADLSNCVFQLTNNDDATIYLDLTTKWTKYGIDMSGTGRPMEVQFRFSCYGTSLPVTIYIDDVSAKSCLPRKPNPQCIVLPGTDNYLVNPGFECLGGITAWAGEPLYGTGNESISQFSSTNKNPTRSGSGMAGLLLDGSQLPYPGSGIYVYQRDITYEITRKFNKISFWVSVDAKLNNVTGCLLRVGTGTGYYIYDTDISYLTTKWTKFEIKDIEPTTYDSFEISVFECKSPVQPLLYIDDVYFGIDKTSPPVPTTTSVEPTPTPTTIPCTSTPYLDDPSFESGDANTWLFFDGSPQQDAMFYIDSAGTYAAPHAGYSVGVIEFPTSGGFNQIFKPMEGLCVGEVFSASAWFMIPNGYDASQCTFDLGISARSSPVSAVAAGVWTKAEVVSMSSGSAFPYIYVGVNCIDSTSIVVLIDDIQFGPPPPCNVNPSILDGSFESGDLSIWNSGVAQGNELIAITATKSRTGKKSLEITFPKISNGAGFGRDFDACVGANYTFRMWYFIPKAYKDISCTVSASPYYTADYVYEEVSMYGQWVELKMDFLSGGVNNHVDFGVSCMNQLQKVVVYIDDVSITKR